MNELKTKWKEAVLLCLKAVQKVTTQLKLHRITSNMRGAFLVAFAKLRKATIIFVVSVSLSVRPSVSITRLPLNWYA